MLVRLALVAGLLAAAPASAEVRRAVLVGIDAYGEAPLASPPPARTWSSLEGAVADAEAMRAVLVARFGFADAGITLLRNREATRKAILDAVRGLVAASKPGDVAVLYYAGHGSQVRNSLTKEADGRDETLVPWDSRSGADDIRDKELAAELEKVREGVQLTVILDSCHSGSATRGPATMKLRQIDPDLSKDFPDASEPRPDRKGVLTLSAAQDYQPAAEARDDKGSPHGAFTASLLRVLASAPVSSTADAIFQATREDLRARGFYQEPVLEGPAARRGAPLLGPKTRGGGKTIAAVVKVSGKQVTLRTGFATGVGPGSVFVRQGAPALRVETRTCAFIECVAEAVGGASLAGVGNTTLFELERLAAPREASLRVLVPARPPDGEAVAAAARALAPLRDAKELTWVDDPAGILPTHTVTWAADGWRLVGPDGAAVALGAAPTADAVRAALAKQPPRGDREAPCDARPCLYVRLPPPRDLVEKLPIGRTAQDAIQRVDAEDAAEYALSGRLAADGGVEYAWVRLVVPAARCTGPEGEVHGARGPDACRAAKGRWAVANRPPPATLPPRSRWASLAEAPAAELERTAAQIARVSSLLKLRPPPGEGTFPYRIALRRTGTQELVSGGVVHAGSYELVLAADGPLEGISRRRVYVLALQSDGAINPIYPASNVENQFPPPRTDPKRLYVLRGDIPVGEPYGVDTVVMLVSEEPIPNLDALAQAAVLDGPPRTRGAAGSTALSDLLFEQVSRTRGVGGAPPTSRWSLQRVQFDTQP